MDLNLDELEGIAKGLRRDVVEMIYLAKSGHPGGSLSALDILTTLYFANVLKYDPKNPAMQDRDRFILAKGHAAPALYATLCKAGYFGAPELKTLRKLHSNLQGHPDRLKCPGVEVSTGSLGQGLSIASGVALGLKKKSLASCTFALLGDGECQEGQVWEAAMFASHCKLDNLCALIDLNGLQIDGPVSDVMSLNDLADKFSAFGWNVKVVDGHDISALKLAFDEVKAKVGNTAKPSCIIAKTVKGKGVSFMENEAGWHGKAPNEDQYKQAMEELSA